MVRSKICTRCGFESYIGDDIQKAYQQGKSDAIYEAFHIADCTHTDCWDCAFGEADICKLQQFYGQLKEQSNDR